jgi:hypothetical protein
MRCPYIMVRAALLLCFSLLATPAALTAQSDVCTTRVFPVKVMTESGRIVWGLTTDNFELSGKHQHIKPTLVTPDATIGRLLLVLDASGSMVNSRDSWEFYIRRAAALVQSLPSNMPVGFVAFGKTVEAQFPISTDRDALMTELENLSNRHNKLPGQAGTALWDSLRNSLQLFGRIRVGDTIYVISDGVDNTSQTSVSQFVRAALPARMFAMIPAGSVSGGPTSEERAGPNQLMRAVRFLGGTSVILRDTGTLFDRRDKIEREMLKSHDLPESLTNQTLQILFTYLVEFQLPNSGAKISDWKLELKGTAEKNPMILYSDEGSVCTP